MNMTDFALGMVTGAIVFILVLAYFIMPKTKGYYNKKIRELQEEVVNIKGQKISDRPQVIVHHYDNPDLLVDSFWFELPVSNDQAIELARYAVHMNTLSHAAASSLGISRTDFEAYRDELILRGIIWWKDPDEHTRGITWGALGRSYFAAHAKMETKREKKHFAVSSLPYPIDA